MAPGNKHLMRITSNTSPRARLYLTNLKIFKINVRKVTRYSGTSSPRPPSLIWRNVLVIFEFPHFGFGVPWFPWPGEMVEVEGGG